MRLTEYIPLQQGLRLLLAILQLLAELLTEYIPLQQGLRPGRLLYPQPAKYSHRVYSIQQGLYCRYRLKGMTFRFYIQPEHLFFVAELRR